MRKGILIGIGILIILLALAGTGSAWPSQSGTTCGNVCHTTNGSFNGVLFNDTHKFNGTLRPVVATSCAYCHIQLPTDGGTTYNMNLTSNGSLYNSTHRNNTTLASVNLVGTTGCYNCHNDTVANNFSLISGAGILLANETCGYCHPKLVDDWNLSIHRSPTGNASNGWNTSVTCVICHLEHNATARVATINTSCVDCHGPTTGRKHGTPGYNVTQCKYCHLPKVLTVNTTYDTRSHTWNYTTQLISSPGDERHAAVFEELKNVTKNDSVTKQSCDMCHGNSQIPSVNMRLSYRLTKHYNASVANVSSNAATPYCDDCHKTTLTTEVINETNTCRNSGCHISMNESHASNIGGADCTNCHFNNSDPLKTHNLYFNNGSEIKYSCKLCHTADTNKSINAVIDEWNSSAHNDRLNSVEGGPNHLFNISKLNATTGIVGNQTASCLKCHSPLDWNPAIADSSSTKVDLTATYKGIECSVCHNIHDMDNWSAATGKVYAWYNGSAIQVSATEYRANYTNVSDTTELCGNCHSNIRYGSTGPGLTTASSRNSYTGFVYPHGFPAKDLFMGSPKQAGQGFECIKCHMYKNTSYGVGTQSDSEKITGHSFKVNETGLQNTSCGTTCHDGVTFPTIPERIEAIQSEVEDQWNATNTTVMGAFYNVNSSGQVKALSLNKLSQAYWNLKLVSSDESWGVHNPEMAKSLLDDAVTLANEANVSLGQALVSTVNLTAGWNLKALENASAVTSPVSIMSSVSSNITVVWGYNTSNPSDPWELYDPNMPSSLNDLTEIVSGEGYWIYALRDCVWTV